jgi:putative SOS response-associated peptidase YedK
MCGRISLHSPPRYFAEELDAEVVTGVDRSYEPSWNVGPTCEILGASDSEATPIRSRALQRYRWGLVPSWASSPAQSKGAFNARAETVATKASFRSAFERRRLLVPVDEFYEWKKTDGSKQPYAFRRADGHPLVFAGLWEPWRPSKGEAVVLSAAIITTAAGADMEPIHDRQPVVLGPEAWDRWLDPTCHDRDELEALLAPSPSGVLVRYPVDRRVGNVRNDGPELVEALADH